MDVVDEYFEECDAQCLRNYVQDYVAEDKNPDELGDSDFEYDSTSDDGDDLDSLAVRFTFIILPSSWFYYEVINFEMIFVLFIRNR